MQNAPSLFLTAGPRLLNGCARIRQFQCAAEANCRMFLDIRQSRPDVEANYRMFLSYSTISVHCAEWFAFLGIFRWSEKKEIVDMREFISHFHCLLFVDTLKLMTLSY